MKQEKYYYSDPLKDEFSGIEKKTISIDENYKYINKNIFYKIASFFVYNAVRFFAFIHCKLKFSYKIKNKQVLKKHKREGYFMYGNHTLLGGDAFFPTIVNFPKKPYVIVNADNVSTKGTKNLVMMLGALPIPTKMSGMNVFKNAMEKRHVQNHPIVVYPEAHIWPYCTFIRPYLPTSFRYPAELNSPVYASTTTFQERKHRKTPKVTIYIDGPFYPDKHLSIKENQLKLHKQVYDAMVERSKNNNYTRIIYEHK